MRKIYSAVQVFFIAIVLAAIGSTISNIDALTGIGSLMSFAGGIMSIVSIYQLRYENQRFAKALRAVWLYLASALVAVVVCVVLFVRMSAGGSDFLLTILPLVTFFVVVGLLLRMQYCIYAGFDEMRETRAIDYPPRRILWCFYLTVIGIAIALASLVGMIAIMIGGLMIGDEAAIYALVDGLAMASNLLLVISVAIEAIHLWLVFTYMQAVREAEEAEARERWDSMR